MLPTECGDVLSLLRVVFNKPEGFVDLTLFNFLTVVVANFLEAVVVVDFARLLPILLPVFLTLSTPTTSPHSLVNAE